VVGTPYRLEAPRRQTEPISAWTIELETHGRECNVAIIWRWESVGRGYWQSSVISRMTRENRRHLFGEKAMYWYLYSAIADPPWPVQARRNAVHEAEDGA
jgi:hypothetical protein